MLRQYHAEEAARHAASGTSARASSTISEFVVEDVFTITGRGQVVTGRTTLGTMRVDDRVVVLRAGAESAETRITGIEMFRKRATEAPAGVSAGLLLAGKVEVGRGDIIRAAPGA